jgi:hypothetical protein
MSDKKKSATELRRMQQHQSQRAAPYAEADDMRHLQKTTGKPKKEKK